MTLVPAIIFWPLAVIFWCLVAVAALFFLTFLLLVSDVFLLVRWTPSRAFAPVCVVLGHTDEGMDEDDPEFGICVRCGSVIWPMGD